MLYTLKRGLSNFQCSNYICIRKYNFYGRKTCITSFISEFDVGQYVSNELLAVCLLH